MSRSLKASAVACWAWAVGMAPNARSAASAMTTTTSRINTSGPEVSTMKHNGDERLGSALGREEALARARVHDKPIRDRAQPFETGGNEPAPFSLLALWC